jgi:hypothetical protein
VCECNETGRCQWCGGSGVFGYIGFGEPDRTRGDCNICHGSGECRFCFQAFARTERWQGRYDSGDCVSCGALGRCSSCHGSGCSFCHNTGVCQSCGGSGSDGSSKDDSEDDSEADHELDSIAKLISRLRATKPGRTAGLEDYLLRQRIAAATIFAKGAVVGAILGWLGGNGPEDVVTAAIVLGFITFAFAKNKSLISRRVVADLTETDLKRKGRLTPSSEQAIHEFRTGQSQNRSVVSEFPKSTTIKTVKADGEIVTSISSTPVTDAIKSGNLSEVQRILDSGRLTSREAVELCLAIECNSLEITRLLINRGWDVDQGIYETVVGEEEQFLIAPIHLADQSSSTEILELLLDLGVNTEARTRGNLTALHRCCRRGDIRHAELLIERKAAVDATTDSNETPLTIACSENFSELAKRLILSGAEINHRIDQGHTPIFFAAANGNADLVEFLLNHQADLNIPEDNIGFTPLHIAAQNGYVDVLKVLVAYGADLSLTDHAGRTARSVADDAGEKEAAALLEQAEE